MKIKSLTKLAMSGVALAAVAATLGTSTYAWYVINPTANVTNVEASTQANGETSILVSKDGSNFSGKIAFAATDFTSNNKPGNVKGAFVPVTTSDATNFYTAEEYAKVIDDDDDTTAATSTNYLKFNVWVKAGATGNVAVKLSAKNTTDSLPTQYAYQSVTASKAATSSFTVDALQAMRTAVFVGGTLSKTYDTLAISYTDAYDAENRYEPSCDVTDDTKLSGTTTLIGAGENGADATSPTLSGAHLYYAQVMNEMPVTYADTMTVTTATDIANVSIATANVAVQLTFVVWLEGGDDLCFDACGGQDFEFGLQFDAAD